MGRTAGEGVVGEEDSWGGSSMWGGQMEKKVVGGKERWGGVSRWGGHLGRR